MSEDQVSALKREHDAKIRKTLTKAKVFCALACVSCLIPLIPHIKPLCEAQALWFQRSGSMMTVFAIIAQTNASTLPDMIRGGVFAESYAFYHKYKNVVGVVTVLSALLVVTGTLVWGYGDIPFNWLFSTGKPPGTCS